MPHCYEELHITVKQPKMAFAAFYYLFLLAVSTASAQTTGAPKKYDCNNLIANSTKQAINELDYCTYPTHKINESCVAESCPKLKTSLCSLNNDESANLENVNKTLNIINECLKQVQICGFSINPDHIPGLIFNANELIPIPGLSSTCSVKPNSSYINNINHTNVAVSIPDFPNTNVLNISVQVQKLSYDATVICSVQGPLNTSPLNIPFKGEIDISCNRFLQLNNITGNTIQITHVKINPKFKILDAPPLLSVEPLAPLLDSTTTNLAKNSSFAEKYGQFIMQIVISAFEAANKQCTETE